MAHVGEKLALGAVGGLRGVARFFHLALGLFALGDVVDEGGEEALASHGDRRDGHLGGEAHRTCAGL